MYTGNTDLAILLNKDAFEPDPMVFAFEGRLHKQRYVGHGTTHRARTAAPHLLFLAHRLLHSALCTSTMLWPRNVTLPLSSSSALHGYMEGAQRRLHSLEADFNISAFSTVGDVLSDHRIFSTWQFISVVTWRDARSRSREWHWVSHHVKASI